MKKCGDERGFVEAILRENFGDCNGMDNVRFTALA
jgi:hypothetical protein